MLTASASTYLPYAVGSYVLQLLRVSRIWVIAEQPVVAERLMDLFDLFCAGPRIIRLNMGQQANYVM